MQVVEITEVKNNSKRINTPFGYFGSKNKIALQLSENLPPHNCWVEVFCGSAALTLRKKPAAIEIINDLDKEIVNFFEQLRNNYEALCRLIELTPYSEYELESARLNGGDISDLERARRFLVQSMMAINGIFGEQPGGFSYSDSYSRNGHDARVNRWNNLPERLKPVIERLKGVRIENKDGRRLLKRYINRPASLIYLDPPYFVQRTNGYKIDSFDMNFHAELLEIANHAKCMIFISGYDNDLYNDLLLDKDGWAKKELKTHTKDSKGGIHDRTEVVWMNKYFIKALKENRIPVRLSKKEKTQNKVNPERK